MPIETIVEWVENNPIFYRVAISILLVILSFPLGWFFKKIVHALRSRIFSKTKTDLDNRLAEVLEKRAKSIVFAILALYALWEVQLVTTEVSAGVQRVVKLIDAFIFIYAGVVGVSIAIGMVRVVIDYYLEESAKSQEQDTRQLMTVAPLARNLISLLVILVASAIVMEHFSINVGSLLVSLGVGSLAVALAAQDTIANIIAGVIIAIDQPFRVGDRIQLQNGVLADVKLIGLRSTRILDFDNNFLIVPNSELIKSTIINFAYPTHQIRVLVFFNVVFGSNIETIREIGLQAMKSHPFVLETPSPEVQVLKVSDLGLEVRFVSYVADFTQRFDTEIQLREQLHQLLISKGINLAIPQRIVQLNRNEELTPQHHKSEKGIEKKS